MSLLKFRKTLEKCVICGKMSPWRSKVTGDAVCSGRCLSKHYLQNRGKYEIFTKPDRKSGVELPARKTW